MTNKTYRYPGITPFLKEQRNVFFGRDRDVENLKNLILVRNQVLLYAKSGVGKTSLLNAGVLPLLTEKHSSIQIRFTAYTQDSKISPIENLINKINTQKSEKVTILDMLVENTDYTKSLWYYIKQAQLLQKEKSYIIVIDQFEELFDYPDNQIEEFKEQLSQIIKTETPDEIFELIAQKPELEEHRAIDDLYREIKVKIVYAIRSDKLSLLNQLSDKISNIQRDYYELKPLTDKQAIQAIVNPARAKNENFITETFNFDEQAVDKIVDALRDKDSQSIETTQLQIVCHRIEEIVLQKQKKILGKKLIKITKGDLPEFKDIFFSFYTNAVEQTAEIEKTHIFIEDQLIQNKQRISLDEIICKKHINNNTLKKLTYAHLLRAEPNSTGGFSYELSHDTLVEPILISREKRKTKEEEIKATKERHEELRIEKEKQAKLRIENDKKRKRQRQIIIIVSIAAVISMAFGVFGFVNMKKAEESLIIAKNSLEKFETAESINTQNTINKLFNKAKEDTAVGYYFNAYATLDSISKLNSGADSIVNNNISTIEMRIEIKNKLFGKAKGYVTAENYTDAGKILDEISKLNSGADSILISNSIIEMREEIKSLKK